MRIAACAVGVLALALIDARAHDAPTGWSYSVACCSGYDCAELPAGTVKEGSNGYQITLMPGQHPMVTGDIFRATVPYGSSKIKDAPDGLYHACILKSSQSIICLYVGSRGF